MRKLDAGDHSLYFTTEDTSFFKELSTKNNYSKCFILVDEHTEEHCLPFFFSQYPIHKDAEIICIEAGEENKHLQTCQGVWEALSELGADRKSLLINLGGGVVTDLGGFVASTFKRGIDFINVPTTLLAMVDASVGGKTGVDLGPLKNQVGVINNPIGIVIDARFLATLPNNEFRSGYAEMLKHGLIQDSEYWAQLADFSNIKKEEIDSFIAHSVAIKQKVVAEDPRENGLRKILNFGHTLGHAIESYFLSNENKTTLLHGEAIAIGMIMEAFLAKEICGLSEKECEEIKKVFNAIYPKVTIDPQEESEIVKLLIFDKKNSHGKIQFALLKAIGVPQWDIEVPEGSITKSFAYYRNA